MAKSYPADLKVFRYNERSHLFPLEKTNGNLTEKYFEFESSTYLHKGCRNAHPFGASKKFLRKFIPNLFQLGSTKLSGVSEKILSGKKPSLVGIERSKRTLFFRSKKFFEKTICLKTSLICSHWQRTFGDSNFEKDKICPPT
ncbi:MAG: hypothetical protein ACLU3N_09140 [Lachnospiraceae bacterium]